MALGLALNNALSGLRLNQEALSVLSQNIANVNTEGYSRQYIAQNAVYLGGTGNGVQIDSILRRVNDYLLRTVQSQGSELQRTNVINDYQGRLQTLLGQPGASNSLDSTMTTFFNVLQQLSDSPDSASARSGVLSSATALTTQISNLASSMEDLRFQADRDIQASVDVANQQISRLFDLNGAIAAASVSNQPTAGLLDERDKALRTLAEQMDISVVYNQYGGVNITAGNGIPLVDDVPRKLTYQSSQSLDAFINDKPLGALNVVALDDKGNQLGSPITLVSGAASPDVTSFISSGKIGGLLQLRDDIMPLMLIELDNLASGLRDAINEVHNSGTAYPPPNALTGTRAVSATDTYDWSGSVRIAVLTADGDPVPAFFSDESYTGLRPLTIDLSSLSSGDADGTADVQTIIDEINQHFRAPTAKVELGDLNNIQLVSDSANLPGAAHTFDFDFDLENIASGHAQFFVTNVSVLDDGANDITDVTQAAHTVDLAAASTYTTTDGSGDVQIRLSNVPTGLKAGDTVYLSAPSVADVNGIDPSALTGLLTVTSVDGNTITVSTSGTANADGVVADGTPGTLQPPVDVGGGSVVRSKGNGALQVDLGANPSSAYYDITVTVAVVNDDGSVSNSDITYRVQNNQQNLMNDRFSASAVTDDATRVTPATSNTLLRAMLVDANGKEITKVNGKYISQEGYLKIVAANGMSVAIDSLDSSQNGNDESVPPDTGTGRGFSYFFELNNFFESNESSNTGDTVKNSAINLHIQDRLLNDPNLISTGQLTVSPQPSNPDDPPQYTYTLYSGDNSIASQLANLRNANISFAAAGNLPQAGVTPSVYASYVLASFASQASTADQQYSTANTFYEAYKSQSDAVSGVNLDEELANTVIFQNAYTATARVINVVNEMFGELLNTVSG